LQIRRLPSPSPSPCTFCTCIEKLLSQNPELGRPGRVPGTRELFIPKTLFVVPYRVSNTVLEVLRVYHHLPGVPAPVNPQNLRNQSVGVGMTLHKINGSKWLTNQLKVVLRPGFETPG
jgi:hypothetical protein